MVRLIPVEVKGKVEWTPDAPDGCPCGFRGILLAGPRGCPECAMRVWSWACPSCGEVQVDDEHVHRDGPLPPSVLRSA